MQGSQLPIVPSKQDKKKYLTPRALKTAVHALISSKLDYCKSILIGLPSSQIMRFQNIMNSSAWLISGVKKFEHTTPILKDLHWLPIEQCIQFKVLTMTFKALNGLTPQYLSDLPKPYTPERSLRSADQELLCIPKTCAKKSMALGPSLQHQHTVMPSRSTFISWPH